MVLTARTCILTRTAWIVFALIGAFAPRSTADWPQYRADATRSGYTPEALPKELSLVWARHARHPPNRAWVGRSLARSRMKFDWAYSVVVANDACYFGSSADDKVYAVEAATGRASLPAVRSALPRPSGEIGSSLPAMTAFFTVFRRRMVNSCGNYAGGPMRTS